LAGNAARVIDTDRREPRRGAAPLPIERQVFDLLEFLVRNRHRVVSKDDLLASGLGRRIVSEIDAVQPDQRRPSRDRRQRRPALIRTIIGKGIRFIGAVRSGSSMASAVIFLVLAAHQPGA